MQGGQGRGGPRQGYTGRGSGAGNGMGAAVTYGGMPGYMYNNWMGYNNFHLQGLIPMPPLMRPTYGRGSATRPFVPLGVQGAGILKRPTGPPQGPVVHGRNHSRGYGGRAWGGRGRKNLTKEALDADLDEWRMKDKKLGGQSLDADLDEYWKKKNTIVSQDQGDEMKDPGLNVAEASHSSAEEAVEEDRVPAPMVGGNSSRKGNSDKVSAEDTELEAGPSDS